jgi:hypothetical protein
MTLEITDEERVILKSFLESYLGNLREEIVKTEKHDFKAPLKREEEVIKDIIGRLS